MSIQTSLSESRAIPTRTVLINDTTQLPHDYCTTPGGTLFSTTPGGTRIIYDRKFLLDRRNSPIAQTPQPTCQSSVDTASVAAERDEELEDECDVVTGTCGGPRSFIA
uniref:Eukaryotic translation initiation factor 4E binding protein 2 n=1 Tax=Neogobius melanostomus TaxID=47308 RepID=A0A8C6UW46_9GOBI